MGREILVKQDGDGKKRIIWFLILIAVLVLVGVGLLIWHLVPKDYDKVLVLNSDELANAVGNEEMNNFRQELLNLLRKKGIIGDNEEVKDVVVREGTAVSSANVDEDGGYRTTTTFLIDIDSIKQTYVVRILGSDKKLDGTMAQIYCPKTGESRYPESKCEGMYRINNSTIDYKIPYETKLESGERILIKSLDTAKKQGEWKSIVQVYLYSCDDNNPPVAEAEEVVRKWVEDLGDEFGEYYTYNIRTGYCEGDAI